MRSIANFVELACKDFTPAVTRVFQIIEVSVERLTVVALRIALSSRTIAIGTFFWKDFSTSTQLAHGYPVFPCRTLTYQTLTAVTATKNTKHFHQTGPNTTVAWNTMNAEKLWNNLK